VLTRVRVAAPFAALAVVLGLASVDVSLGAVLGLILAAVLARRVSFWITVVAAVWVLALLAVLYIPGPYDSFAGRAAVPVLSAYTGLFLAAWAAGCGLYQRRRNRRQVEALAGSRSHAVMAEAATTDVASLGAAAGGAQTSASTTTGVVTLTAPMQVPTSPAPSNGNPNTGHDAVGWPSEFRMRAFLLATLGVAILAAVLRFWGTVPPLFSPNPDAAREVLSYHTNIVLGLLWEAFTIGMAVSLFRLLAGPRTGRWLYAVFTVLFVAGSALGASKNSVLIGIATGMIATVSVWLGRRRGRRLRLKRSTVLIVVAAACAVLGAVVYLGGQRTLSGSGNFEDTFRQQYGSNAVTASLGSLDLSLSSSAETFGRLWQQHDEFGLGLGRYSLIFTGHPGHALFGAHSDQDLYYITGELSQPYYMNTASFVAIPLLDWGVVGAGVFLVLVGLAVGMADRKLGLSSSAAAQLGRATIIYFAGFGVYEFYPLVQPTWLATIPALVILHLLLTRSNLRQDAVGLARRALRRGPTG
jgi:hypothetical protein